MGPYKVVGQALPQTVSNKNISISTFRSFIGKGLKVKIHSINRKNNTKKAKQDKDVDDCTFEEKHIFYEEMSMSVRFYITSF